MQTQAEKDEVLAIATSEKEGADSSLAEQSGDVIEVKRIANVKKDQSKLTPSAEFDMQTI